VTEAARAGDPAALAVMSEHSRWLAIGLANLACVLDPELFVIGGGLVEACDLLIEPTRRAFSQLVEGGSIRSNVEIVPAALGQLAGAVGAALAARSSTLA